MEQEMHFIVLRSDPAIQERLLAMLDKGLIWESTRINADGSANLTGNTRVTNNPLTNEKTREGTAKDFAYTRAIHFYVFGSTLF